MKIAVLGTGNVGGTLGRRWGAKGHTVLFGSRDPHSEKARQLDAETGDNVRVTTIGEAAGEADLIVLATPWPSAREVLEQAGGAVGKILVDCINPLNQEFTGLDLGFTESASERIAEWAPEAVVVKAFNTVSAAAMTDPMFNSEAATLFVCGDDDAARRVVMDLAAELDFDAVDAGPLKNARYLEPLAMLYIHLAMNGWGSNCAFKIMKRPNP